MMKYLEGFKQFESSDSEKTRLETIVSEFFDLMDIPAPWTINDEGHVDVQGHVGLSLNQNKKILGITRLPFQFGEVTESFLVDGLDLTTLEGFPKRVFNLTLINLLNVKSFDGLTQTHIRGLLAVRNCGFESLRGLPEQVDIAMDLQQIPIRSLEGLPEHINHGLSISKTNIVDLRGAPKTVNGYFECFDSKSLFSLKGCPERVTGNLFLVRNRLQNCKGLPKYIGGSLNLAGNQLTSLEGCPEVIYHNFQCQVNQLTDLKGGPKEVGERYDVSDNELKSLEGLPKDLTFFLASNNLSLCDPNFLKDVNIKMGCNLSTTPLHTLIMQFYQDGMATPDIIVKNFIPSLDYGYFRMVKGKPCLIEHRLLEALDELGIKTYDQEKLNYVGYNIVDENLYII